MGDVGSLHADITSLEWHATHVWDKKANGWVTKADAGEIAAGVVLPKYKVVCKNCGKTYGQHWGQYCTPNMQVVGGTFAPYPPYPLIAEPVSAFDLQPNLDDL